MYLYRATAFDGVRTFDGLASGGSRVCSVVACSSADINTCSVRFPEYTANSTLRFSTLSVTARVPTPSFVSMLEARDAAFFPTSVDVAILPLAPTQYAYREWLEDSDGTTVMELNLLDSNPELLSFGVWGRLFERDGSDPTEPRDDHPGAAPSLSTPLAVILLSVICLVFV